VFVDGCFWHGCPDHGSWPSNNAAFWRKKIDTNQRRDSDTNERLSAEGWQVVRIWEHEDTVCAADRIQQLVESRRPRVAGGMLPDPSPNAR
jgi:DNA mismatch endonuclease (patch repair protein)